MKKAPHRPEKGDQNDPVTGNSQAGLFEKRRVEEEKKEGTQVNA
jgi:hypothetical protein